MVLGCDEMRNFLLGVAKVVKRQRPKNQAGRILHPLQGQGREVLSAGFAEIELDAPVQVFTQALLDDGARVTVWAKGGLGVDFHKMAYYSTCSSGDLR